MPNTNTPQQSLQLVPSCALTSSTLIEALWGRVEGNLSRGELEWFSQATTHADFVARNLQSTISGIGCLVNEDVDGGYFQVNQSVSSLLFFIEESLGSIIGMTHVGCEAEYKLRMMAEEKLKQINARSSAKSNVNRGGAE